ncbi:MAG TPA: hypothetical protein VKQ32_02690 [Polyangia bacterium]|nr:hypothetical protein [Polyangia bacterium]
MKGDDIRLHELLARGRLGGPVYDEVLEKVLARTAPARAPRRWLRIVVLPGIAVAGLAAWLLVARPADDGFSAKGTGGANGALAVGCAPSGARACPVGGTLMFTVNAALASGTLGAYAERVGDPAHERIWYFPDGAGEAPTVAPGAGTTVVPRGIRVGPEHRPGRYRVTVWLADHPIARGEVDAAPAKAIRARASFDLEITR